MRASLDYDEDDEDDDFAEIEEADTVDNYFSDDDSENLINKIFEKCKNKKGREAIIIDIALVNSTVVQNYKQKLTNNSRGISRGSGRGPGRGRVNLQASRNCG
jgi:hypothetical protein